MKSKLAVAILQSMILGALTIPVLAKFEAKPPGAGSLRVDVQPPEGLEGHSPSSPQAISLPGVYSCHYTVTNVSKEPVEFALYSCSVWDNWATDSKEVFVQTGGCRANVLIDHVLQPDDSFYGYVGVTTNTPARSTTRPFHLILTPCSTDREHPKQLNHFLSNFIHLQLEKDRRHQPLKIGSPQYKTD